MKNTPREKPNYGRRAGIAVVGLASLAALFAVCKKDTEKVLAASSESPAADSPAPHHDSRKSVRARTHAVKTPSETPDEVDPEEAHNNSWKQLFPIGKEPTTVDEACRNFLQTGAVEANIRQKSITLGLLKLQILTPNDKRATASVFELFDQCTNADTDADQFSEVLKIGLQDKNTEVVRFLSHAIQEECRTRLVGEREALLNKELYDKQAEGDDNCYALDMTTSYDRCLASANEAYINCVPLMSNADDYAHCMNTVPNCLDDSSLDSPRDACYEEAAAQLEKSFMQPCLKDVAQEHGFDAEALNALAE